MADLLLTAYPQIRTIRAAPQPHSFCFCCCRFRFSSAISRSSIIVRLPEQRRSKGGGRRSCDLSVRMASSKNKGQVPDTEPVPGSLPVSEQLTPHDMWTWNSLTHWKHWHGLWTMYNPLESPQVVKSYRSVRSLWPVDEERVHLYHRNQWYAFTGYEGENVNWEYGPWAMYELKHSTANGIWHPNSLDHRILQFQHGDLCWVQLALKPGDPKCVVFNELHFMASPTARMPVIMGYDSKDQLSIALMVEETLNSDKIPDSSWNGRLWKHSFDSIVPTRDEPAGVFIGKETSLTTSLVSTTLEAQWKGFRGSLSDDNSDYTLVHLPHSVTVYAPKKALVGKPHSYYVSWVVNEAQVRVLSACYSADGKLEFVKSGIYDKVSDQS